MQELLSLLGLGGGGLLTKEAYDELGNAGEMAQTRSEQIGDQAVDMARFRGYGVTGPSGSSSVDASGNTNFQLSEGQQRFADMAGMGSASFMQQAVQGSPEREQSIYDRIRAMQMPGEERDRMALENRLVQQGRGGVRTNMYGGTPQEFALNKAQAEAQNAAAYEAIKLAMEQQSQQGNLAGLFGKLQYMPESNLRDTFNTGMNAAGFEDVGRRNAAAMFSEANMSGLAAKPASRLGQANLMGQLGTAALSGGAGMLSSVANQGGDFLTGLLSSLGLGD